MPPLRSLRPPRAFALPATVVVALFGVTGCGRDSPSPQEESAAVRRVAVHYLQAVARRDWRGACAHWSERGEGELRRLAQRTGMSERSCEDVLRRAYGREDADWQRLLAAGLAHARVHFDDSGLARLDVEPAMPPLRKIDGAWRFDALAT